MKRVIGILATVALSVSALGGLAAADGNTSVTSTSATCSIYNTGSESYNSCVSNSTQSAQVTCVNDVYVLNENSQNAGTGGAVVTDNTNGGSAVSGTAKNENGNTVTIGASCGTPAATTTTSTGSSTSTPAGGKGGGSGAGSGASSTSTAPAPQVVAPTGAVEAGAGGGSRVSDEAIAGLTGSILTIGVGSVLVFKRVLS